MGDSKQVIVPIPLSDLGHFQSIPLAMLPTACQAKTKDGRPCERRVTYLLWTNLDAEVRLACLCQSCYDVAQEAQRG
mgnify:CR=1 FL=1